VDPQALRARISVELVEAEMSRRAGNEGRARVCARRAAGLAAGAYFESRGVHSPTRSAYDQLRLLQREENLPEETRLAAARLVARVTTVGQLPHPQDPLEDARGLVKSLLKAAGQSTH
jgi:hypothetical protein